ncbi:MAG: hypothetical protein MI673_00145 [Thiotrichales bacterium]|nr:hypothetical protein [Thiotrichales bacterium]
MQKHRRNLLKRILIIAACTASGLAPLIARALTPGKRNKPAFTSADQDSAWQNLFPGQSATPSEAVHIGVHDLVENGSVVPIKVNCDLAAVESISIFVEKNPNPLIAHFILNPRCKAFVATRIKVQQPSNITVIAKSGDQLFSATRFVEVVAGGCG